MRKLVDKYPDKVKALKERLELGTRVEGTQLKFGLLTQEDVMAIFPIEEYGEVQLIYTHMMDKLTEELGLMELFNDYYLGRISTDEVETRFVFDVYSKLDARATNLGLTPDKYLENLFSEYFEKV